ncbi:MAG TPA: sigma-70 family RNA polymerase sigma factor [Candidatus Kryptonia bacterium]
MAEENLQELTTDNELVSRAQRGDMNAFENLVEKYNRHVLSLAFSYARNSDDAKDIYQETLIRAFRAIGKFEFRSEFSTWLYRIATNVCLSFKSSQNRDAEVFKRDIMKGDDDADGRSIISESAGPDSVEGEYMRMELAKHIERALSVLSPMQRLVFTMKHYEGYKLKEIASISNCTIGTIKKHLYMAVRRLQEELVEVFE